MNDDNNNNQQPHPGAAAAAAGGGGGGIILTADVLTCPISFDQMTDPVILCCTDEKQQSFGHVYDKESICASLLAQPNLDPMSNVRYTAKLQYVPCVVLQQYLRSIQQYRPYDDSAFAAAYQQAWDRFMGLGSARGGGGIFGRPQRPLEFADPFGAAAAVAAQQRLVVEMDVPAMIQNIRNEFFPNNNNNNNNQRQPRLPQEGAPFAGALERLEQRAADAQQRNERRAAELRQRNEQRMAEARERNARLVAENQQRMDEQQQRMVRIRGMADEHFAEIRQRNQQEAAQRRQQMEEAQQQMNEAHQRFQQFMQQQEAVRRGQRQQDAPAQPQAAAAAAPRPFGFNPRPVIVFGAAQPNAANNGPQPPPFPPRRQQQLHQGRRRARDRDPAAPVGRRVQPDRRARHARNDV